MSRPLVDIRLEALSTRGGKPPGLDSISVHVRYGEFFTFLGPPHSGKTDVLAGGGRASCRRARAGFSSTARTSAVLPPGQRSVGYVFQEARALAAHDRRGSTWPSVSSSRGCRPEDIAQRVAVVGHATRADRSRCAPAGDEPHRAAATGARPRAWRWSRASCCSTSRWPISIRSPARRCASELARLHRDLAVTTIHGTRDAADALALSDRPRRCCTADACSRSAEPTDVYQHPVSRAVAEALGPANFLPVRVVEVRDLGVVVETEGGHTVPVAGIGTWRMGSRGLLVLRPELLVLTDAGIAAAPASRHRDPASLRGRPSRLRGRHRGGTSGRVERPARWGIASSASADRVRISTSSDTVVIVPED